MSLVVTPACPRHALYVARAESSGLLKATTFEWITGSNTQPAPDGFICTKEATCHQSFHGTKYTTGSTKQTTRLIFPHSIKHLLCPSVRPVTSLHAGRDTTRLFHVPNTGVRLRIRTEGRR